MDLRTPAQWNIAALTSMGLRLSPADRAPTHTSDRFVLQATSAESNVLSVSGALGLKALALTNFVAGSPLASFIKAQLRARGISYVGPELPQGGPWGYRHQFNIADAGFGPRAPRVWNDRAGEVGCELKCADFDLEQIFGVEGVQVLHLSGLVAALSPTTSQACVELARYAKDQGTLVSFDLNYRASFWKERTVELSRAFGAIAEVSDVLIGNEEDFQLALGIQGPPPGGTTLAEELESFQAMIDHARARFSGTQVFATTLREVVSANEHRWGIIVWADGDFHVVPPRPIAVADRIGGGDGSVGGLLYGILRGWDPERCMQFAWATGALAVGSQLDFATPVDENQVWSVWEGNARVQR